jgi:hypothetical protein
MELYVCAANLIGVNPGSHTLQQRSSRGRVGTQSVRDRARPDSPGGHYQPSPPYRSDGLAPETVGYCVSEPCASSSWHRRRRLIELQNRNDF